MAKKSNPVVLPATPGSQLFKNPAAGQTGIPEGLQNDINSAAQGYSAAYNQGSFGTRHPFITAGLGALLMGPSGVMLPMIAQKKDQARKSAAIEAYNSYVKGSLENQKSIDSIAQPRNEAMYGQSLIDEGKRQGLIQPTVPDLFQRNLPGLDGSPAQPTNVPVYSREFMDSMRKGTFAGSDINYLQAMQNHNRQLNYAMPGNMMGNQAPVEGQNGSEGQPFQAGAKVQAGMPEAPQAPFFVSDPQTIMQQMTAAGNAAFTEGQNRYEFDQEAPKRMAEVKKLLAEGKTEQAKALLLGAQTKTEQQRPALVKAQTNQANASASLSNRTDPNLRGGSSSELDLMSPEQRQAYLNKKAGLTPESLNFEQTFQVGALQETANQKDWFGNPTPEAKEAQASLRMLDRFINPGGGTAPAKGGKPSKGKGTTLSSGRQVNL